MATWARRRCFDRNGYTAYSALRRRCNSPSQKDYPNYGARGIECQLSWHEFRDIYFRTDECERCGQELNDNNRRLRAGRTIHRIDSHGHYEEENVAIWCRSCNCGKR